MLATTRCLNPQLQILIELLGVEVLAIVFKEARVAYDTKCSSRPVIGRVMLIKQHVMQELSVCKLRLPVIAHRTSLSYFGVLVKTPK